MKKIGQPVENNGLTISGGEPQEEKNYNILKTWYWLILIRVVSI